MRLSLKRRPVTTILLGGLVCLAIVWLGGWIAERWRFGATDEQARDRVEAEVRDAFDTVSARLRSVARAEADVATPVMAKASDERDLRPLFVRADALVGAESGSVLAVTVYSPAGSPVAWAGRPSQLPVDRIDGPATLFVMPGNQGLRLVLIEPLAVKTSRGFLRVGTVAAERIFSEETSGSDATRPHYRLRTSMVPVELRGVRYEALGEAGRPDTFSIGGSRDEPLLEVTVDPVELHAARTAHRRMVRQVLLLVVALTAALLTGPLLDYRALARARAAYLRATFGVAILIGLVRAILGLATPSGSQPWLSASVFSWSTLLCRHPIDFLLNGFLVVSLVVVFAAPLERWRLSRRHARAAVSDDGGRMGVFLLVQALAGVGLAFGVAGYERLLSSVFARAHVDLLYFSPHPWNGARLSVAVGLVLLHAGFAWLAVLALRACLMRWRFRRGDWHISLLVLACWLVPSLVVVSATTTIDDAPRTAALLVSVAIGVAAFTAPRALTRLRNASQGYRLVVMFLALLAPAFVLYPSMAHFAEAATQRAIETRYGPEVLNKVDTLKARLREAEEEISAREAQLEAFVSVPALPPGNPVPTDAAFLVWRGTPLDRFRVSSAIELYNASGSLVSRFALNLPEEASRQPWHEETCEWKTFGEISPFGAQERQLLHAGRDICSAEGRLGTIVIHVILDDSTFSFVSSQNPYFELLRGEQVRSDSATDAPDVDFVVYGWSRTPTFVSATSAWPIDDELFARIYDSRTPFWTRLTTGGVTSDVYIENDRRGIYAIGYPVLTPIGHCVNLAELSSLVAITYIALLLASAAYRALGFRRVVSGRTLLREVRQSFYRKVFLAFVAASVIPVGTLALVTRAYIADRLRHDVEAAAHKTTAIARRVIEEFTVIQSAGSAVSAPLTDDAMIGLSRVIGQDVNVFNGPRLVATSERDLFASGLLPTWTPSEVYRAIVLDRYPTVISEESAGSFRYMVAAAPLRTGGRDGLLTVPLTLRQQEIEREIDELNRRIVLAAMLFILVGAAFGYPLAERIADPVSRLTRATRRIARGDFDVRIVTTAADELKRLVEAFNLMSAELQRQQGELERTHRLEAWAEMARQVAHEIKNPLTPIQLSAEHLRRVHADRGKPLEPVLEGCVDSILTQVRLLRQIASEFSSFASSPTARRAPAALDELVEEVLRPYIVGAGDRLHFEVDVPANLPRLLIDRTLIGRALTNVIDNALHAMPSGGLLRVSATELDAATVELRVEDTGVGMDEEGLRRLFEPYFSTKAVGTGLGLSIARRNVELNEGTIVVTSERGKGTIVRLSLPVAVEA